MAARSGGLTVGCDGWIVLVGTVVTSVKVWVEVVSPPSPPRPQGASDFHNIGGMLVGSDSGFAPCGLVWSVARKSGDSWGGDVRAAVAEALALRSLAASSLTRGARLAWRGGMGGLHGGGGGVRCGPVKEHLPMMLFDGEGCHRSPWRRACCRVSASVARCHPRRV
jgi:hypothetical protein